LALATYVGGVSIETGVSRTVRNIVTRRRRARSPG